jgi:hypothetical protein
MFSNKLPEECMETLGQQEFFHELGRNGCLVRDLLEGGSNFGRYYESIPVAGSAL